MGFSWKNISTRIKMFFDVHSSVYKISLVSFFIQFGSTLVHTTGNHFLINDLKLLTENELVLIKITSETVSTFCKVIAGYLSDLFRNRKNFLILGYSSVVCFKICFSVCTLTWLLPFWFCRNFFILAQFVDRIFNSIRDGAKDAYALDASTNQQTPSAFAIRKMLSSLGTVFGGIFAFISINYFNISATAMYTISIIPTGLAAIMAFFLIKDVIVNNVSTNKNNFLYTMGISLSFIFSVIYCFYSIDFAYLLLPILVLKNLIFSIFYKNQHGLLKNNIVFIFLIVFARIIGCYFGDFSTTCTISSVILIAFYYFTILENLNNKNNTSNHVSDIFIPIFTLIATILINHFPNIMNCYWDGYEYLGIIKIILITLIGIVLLIKKVFTLSVIQYIIRSLFIIMSCALLATIVSYISLFTFNIYLFSMMLTMFSIILAMKNKFMSTDIFKTVSNKNKMSKFLFLIPLIMFVFCSKVNENMYWIGSKSSTINEKHFPLLFALSYLFISIFSLIYGILLRKKKVIVALFISFSSMICVNALTFHTTTIKAIFTMMLLGCSAAGIDVVISYIVSQTIPSEKTRATVLGLFYTISGFFNFVAGIAMCSIKTKYGIQKVFLTSGVFAVLAMLYLLIFRKSIQEICDK